jgi:hypothetical protein
MVFSLSLYSRQFQLYRMSSSRQSETEQQQKERKKERQRETFPESYMPEAMDFISMLSGQREAKKASARVA